MGVSGLHHQLKTGQKKINVGELRGKTLALDGHALLHRGALSCAEQLAEGEPTTRYAHFAVQRVQMLTNKGITPIVVFDGASTPLKKHTNNERRQSRDQALEVDCAGGWGRGSITYSLSGFRWCSRGHPGAVRQGHLGVKV